MLKALPSSVWKFPMKETQYLIHLGFSFTLTVKTSDCLDPSEITFSWKFSYFILTFALPCRGLHRKGSGFRLVWCRRVAFSTRVLLQYHWWCNGIHLRQGAPVQDYYDIFMQRMYMRPEMWHSIILMDHNSQVPVVVTSPKGWSRGCCLGGNKPRSWRGLDETARQGSHCHDGCPQYVL